MYIFIHIYTCIHTYIYVHVYMYSLFKSSDALALQDCLKVSLSYL